MTRHPERSAKRAVEDQGGSEDFLAYTDKISFQWGISPLHSDCRPHSGRNDIIKPNVHRCHFERSREIPRSRNETKRTRYAAGRGRPALPTASSALKPDALSFRALVEKSPAIETKRNIYAPAKCPRRLCAEKSPAIETERNIHAPAHLPVAARHREIPRDRNENNRTRIPQRFARGGSALTVTDVRKNAYKGI